MNLLYTLTNYPPSVGGAQIHQHLLAQQMQQKHTVEIVSHWDRNRTDWLLGTTIKAPSNQKHYSVDGISVHRIGLSQQEKLQMLPFLPIYYPLMELALPKISSVLENHLTHYAKEASLIHNVRIGREGLTAASLKAARRWDVPFVLTPVHHPRWVGWRYRCYLNLYRQADAIFTLTQSEKNTLVGLQVEEKKIHVIGHGPILAADADAEDFTHRHQIESPIVLFLGQHYDYKGYRQLLSATKIVWEKYPETQFVFIGPPVKDSEKIFKLHADPRIHRLGKVSLQEKTNAIAACSMLCVPSSQESFGGVYTEAWMFNKPVIGCKIPAVSEVIDDGTNGLLVNQQPESIAQGIVNLLNEPDWAKTMGDYGREKVQRQYTWPKIANKAQEAYERTLKAQQS